MWNACRQKDMVWKETAVLCTKIVVKLTEWRKLLERGGKYSLKDNQVVESRGGRKASQKRHGKHCQDYTRVRGKRDVLTGLWVGTRDAKCCTKVQGVQHMTKRP